MIGTIIAILFYIFLAAVIFWLIETKFPAPWNRWCSIGFAVILVIIILSVFLGEYSLPGIGAGKVRVG